MSWPRARGRGKGAAEIVEKALAGGADPGRDELRKIERESCFAISSIATRRRFPNLQLKSSPPERTSHLVKPAVQKSCSRSRQTCVEGVGTIEASLLAFFTLGSRKVEER